MHCHVGSEAEEFQLRSPKHNDIEDVRTRRAGCASPRTLYSAKNASGKSDLAIVEETGISIGSSKS